MATDREIHRLNALLNHPIFIKLMQGGPLAIPQGGFLVEGRRILGGSPTDGQVMTWDEIIRAYVPKTPAAGGGGVTNHALLTNLDYASAGHTGFVAAALFNAQTILAAVSDDTPVAVTVAEQRILGRKTGGNIAALTGAEILAILTMQAAADFNFNLREILSIAAATMNTSAARFTDVNKAITSGKTGVVAAANDTADFLAMVPRPAKFVITHVYVSFKVAPTVQVTIQPRLDTAGLSAAPSWANLSAETAVVAANNYGVLKTLATPVTVSDSNRLGFSVTGAGANGENILVMFVGYQAITTP